MSDEPLAADEPQPAAVALRDPWDALRTATAARVALGRAGTSLPTRALLAFELDHARARDAVHRSLDVPRLQADLATLGLETRVVHSAAADRTVYLSRPDLGRRLDDASRAALDAAANDRGATAPVDVLLVVADGLSAPGVQDHAAAIVGALVPEMDGLSLGPVVVAQQARVALGDEVGAAFGAKVVVMLIGERPGLTAPDSVGLYVTFEPRPGRHDAQRNCISNVRPEGLPPARAAKKLAWLIRASLRLSLSGVALKDESGLLESSDR